MNTQITTKEANGSNTRRDLHQHVTDTIIQQLEKGAVPWHKPWKGESNRIFSLPQNGTTGKHYRGVNILLLWCSALDHEFPTQEWASFKQWQDQKESVRRGEKGTMIVYYDTFEKEVDGEVKEIPFLKSSVVFNRSQLASYTPEEQNEAPSTDLVQRIDRVETFVSETKAIIEHRGDKACYIPSQDKILMPPHGVFMDTDTSTATENYYSTLFHELTHWTGSPERLNREGGKKFGDAHYAMEELVAEIGAAFLCAEFEITAVIKEDHASYIDHWLKVLKENKHCLIPAASAASKATDFLHDLQP